MELTDLTTDEYLTVSQLAERCPAFSQGCIRWLIFNGARNGFNRVVRRVGRKIVLSLKEFNSWVEAQKMVG